MAISTYSELQSAVANWAHRSASSAGSNAETISSIVQNCIVLAEEKFNRRLRTRFQEVALSSTAIDASYQVAIPANTVALKAIWRVSGTEKITLFPKTLEYVVSRHVNAAEAVYYAWEGSYWRFDGVGTVAGVLYRDVPALSDSNTTNWLLTSHPGLYLHAALAEFSVYTVDDQAAAKYTALADQRIAELNTVAHRDGHTGPLMMRAA